MTTNKERINEIWWKRLVGPAEFPLPNDTNHAIHILCNSAPTGAGPFAGSKRGVEWIRLNLREYGAMCKWAAGDSGTVDVPPTAQAPGFNMFGGCNVGVPSGPQQLTQMNAGKDLP